MLFVSSNSFAFASSVVFELSIKLKSNFFRGVLFYLFEMTPSWIKYILQYFIFWGFQSTACTTMSDILFSCLIFVIHFSLCSWSSFRIVEAFAEKVTVMEFIDALNFLLYYISCASTYWMTLFDSYINRSDQYAFWKIFARINDQYPTQLMLKKSSYLITFLILLAGDFICVIFALIHEMNSGYGGRIMHFIFLISIDHRMFFYWLHLKVIAFRLQDI